MDQRSKLKYIRIYLIGFALGILFALHTVVFVQPETGWFVCRRPVPRDPDLLAFH
ncbi:MAG: hypothetical protein GX455_12095 [Phycisphaerae bacterium]|nr:hypothetical protein [Phycisphaerae bacterium]